MPLDIAAKDPAGRDLALVKDFVARHFRLRGTLCLHRQALGLDLLRAPLNVALAPVHFVLRVFALLLGLVRLRQAGAWLAGRRVLLPSRLSRELGRRIEAELLAPRGIAPPSPQQAALIEEYTGVRNAISEMVTTLVVLILGFALFHTATPGILSLAPELSRVTAESSAVSQFPLGQGLGRMWYSAFPVALPVWYVVAVGVVLALAASLVTTFAGVLADPVQSAFGIHRRRLLRLLATVDAAETARPALAREHLLARLADISDTGLSLLRLFRS